MKRSTIKEIDEEISRSHRAYGPQTLNEVEFQKGAAKQLGDILIANEMNRDIRKDVVHLVAFAVKYLEQIQT